MAVSVIKPRTNLSLAGTYQPEVHGTVEQWLDTYPNDRDWMVAAATNGATGELATLSGESLFYIMQFARSGTMRVQIAVSTNGKMYSRGYRWWGTWSPWVAVT